MYDGDTLAFLRQLVLQHSQKSRKELLSISAKTNRISMALSANVFFRVSLTYLQWVVML